MCISNHDLVQLVMSRRALLNNIRYRWTICAGLGNALCGRWSDLTHVFLGRVHHHLANCWWTTILHPSTCYTKISPLPLLPRGMGSHSWRNLYWIELCSQQCSNHRVIRQCNPSQLCLEFVVDLVDLLYLSNWTDRRESNTKVNSSEIRRPLLHLLIHALDISLL